MLSEFTMSKKNISRKKGKNLTRCMMETLSIFYTKNARKKKNIISHLYHHKVGVMMHFHGDLYYVATRILVSFF